MHDVAADMTTPAGCARVAQNAIDHLGGIDIIVNVLDGRTRASGFAALNDEEWRRRSTSTWCAG